MFTSVGTFRYSPKTKKEGARTSSKWWLIIDVCPDLAEYYRHWWNWHNRFGPFQLIKCAWTPHISVVRDEMPPRPEVWEKYAGQEVEFEYSTRVLGTGDYYWIDVLCPRALDIREELGLPRDPEYPLHVSVGVMRR